MAVQPHSAFPGSPPWSFETELGLETEAGSLWVQEVMAAGLDGTRGDRSKAP